MEALLAHPERSAEVQLDPGRLGPLMEAGLRVQITAASVDGRLGQRPFACAKELLSRGLVHVLASDAHAPTLRETGLRAAVEEIGDAELARRLTLDNPHAIISGASI
jgi:protein-tyrosine phosphatase